jgi:hypothetical protein
VSQSIHFHSTPSLLVSLNICYKLFFNLRQGLWRELISLDFQPKLFKPFSPYHACHIPCSSNYPNLITLIIYVEYKSWSFSLCNFVCSFLISSLLDSVKFLGSLSSNVLSLCRSLDMWVQVSHLYKKGQNSPLSILIFTFLINKMCLAAVLSIVIIRGPVVLTALQRQGFS